MKYSTLNRNPFDTAPVRFLSKVKPTKSCWVWTGCIDIGGYGQLRLGRTTSIQAHRLSFILHHGEYPSDNQVVMHLCDNPPCVNPKHLKAGTQKQNVIHSLDIHPRHRNKACGKGHTYDGKNIRGDQICYQCIRSTYKKWRKNGQ